MRFLAFLIPILCFGAEPKKVYLDDVVAKATKAEKGDLMGLLEAIEIVPTNQKIDGNRLFRVEKIKKDSVYDREGVKIGDLVFAQGTNRSKRKPKKFEIKNSLNQ